MDKHLIEEGKTYLAFHGVKFYVHEVTGQKVSFCKVGELERRERSLGWFASSISHEVPNE